MKLSHVVVIALSTVAAGSQAAIDAAVVTSVKDAILADVATASTAGFAVMAVVLATSIGMSLLGRFVSKGASGG
jgi:hypothetical protein